MKIERMMCTPTAAALVLMCTATGAFGGVPPANDDCANATAIGEVTDLAFDTTEATGDGPESSCQGFAPHHNIWYCYTASADGIATIDTCGSSFDTIVTVYDHCGDVVADDEIVCKDVDEEGLCGGGFIPSSGTVPVTAGEIYKIQIDGWSAQNGTGDLTIALEPFGACCLCNATLCIQMTEDECESSGGIYSGDETECIEIDCPDGACCFPDLTCIVTEIANNCIIMGGIWQGIGTTCDTIECPITCGENESFENGNLDGWLFSDPPTPDFPLQVVGHGVQHPSRPDFFASSPTHGCFALVHGWDAADANQIGQMIQVPATAELLCFDYRAQWDVPAGDNIRRFFVTIENPDTGAVYANQVVVQIDPSTGGDAIGSPCIDLTPARGKNARVRFRWAFGSNTDGDVYFQLDNIRWTCTDCDNDNEPDCLQVLPEFDPDPAVVGTGDPVCADAAFIETDTWYPVDTTGAPLVGNDQALHCEQFSGYRPVYFAYRPKFDSNNAYVAIRNQMPLGSGWLVAVYEQCGDEAIACFRPLQVGESFAVQAGETYIIALSAQNFGAGMVEFQVTGPPALLNPDDANDNGVPDECECFGDVNGDQTIDGADFIQVVQAAGQPCNNCPEDVNMDGVVDGQDVNAVWQAMGPCVPFMLPDNLLNAPKHGLNQRRDIIADQLNAVESINK